MTSDLTTLSSKDRQALKIRLFEIDGPPDRSRASVYRERRSRRYAPPEPPSAPAPRELPPPEEPSIITLEELEEARRSLEAEDLDEVNQLPTPPDKE
jgi:hypothetical protein